ncbi:MAG TPA: hypothetical protein VI457_03680 [Methylococcaceae bacterium]|nr:hypothetical protein [Methylococcaceae bacterium]
MILTSKASTFLPRAGELRREIAAALLLKAILLLGLWALIFRWNGERPAARPDVAERFALPSSPAMAQATPDVALSSPSNHQEAPHVR